MRPPKFWDTDPNKVSILSFLLMPLAKIYEYIGLIRWKNGDHIKSNIPVICVGNVNLGGTGKTPTVIYLAIKLIEMKKSVHIVTRGYRGCLKGPIKVDLEVHDANQVGDEPILLAAFAPTWVAKNRLEGLRSARKAGAEVIILDDGMQNPSVYKDITIMVVDAYTGFGNGRIFPSGPLRESLESGLKKSNFILAIGSDGIINPLRRKWSMLNQKEILTGQLQVLKTGMEWERLRVLAFAGIGRPEKFFDSLRSTGADVLKTHSFSDHQMFSELILKRLESEANTMNAQLVTTEKDAARLPQGWRQKVLTLPVRLEISNSSTLVSKLNNLF